MIQKENILASEKILPMQINQAGDLESARGNGDQGNWTGFGQTEKN